MPAAKKTTTTPRKRAATTKSTSAAVARVKSGETSAIEEVASILGVEMTPAQREHELSEQQKRAAKADDVIAAELPNVDIDAAVAKATADDAAETAAAKPERKPFALPSGVTASKVVLDFVTKYASSAPDAGAQGRPFITHKGKLVIATKWLRDYLVETIDPKATSADAGAILRELGYARRQVPMPGAKSAAPWAWTIDAPRGTGSIERQPEPVKSETKS